MAITKCGYKYCTYTCFSSKSDGLLDAVVTLATKRQQCAGTSVVMDKLRALELQLQTTGTDLQTTKAQLQTTKAELQTTKAELQTTKAELQTTKAELQTTRTDLEGRLAAVIGSVSYTNRGQYFV